MKRRMINFILNLFLLVLPCAAWTQNITITYTECKKDFTNPERGFYIPSGTKASNFILLDTKILTAFRNEPQKSGKASYSVQVSIILRGYELDTFKNKPLSESFLNNLQKDFDVVRSAGLKMILRFAYTDKANTGNCKDEYHICPPYGDAPEHIVLNHIQQLKPLLQKNADVIAVMQEGFIGIWGEHFYTDYFGDPSANGIGRISDSSWLQRNEVLKALLDALPATRMLQVRTPQIKQKFVYGPSASVNSSPLLLSGAFNRSYSSRIGFHNDCFLASPDDYGTYYDYGSSSQSKQPASEVLRKYIKADTKFTAVGGETCDDAFSPQNDCAPSGYAEEEMRSMHYSFLNAGYNTSVNNDWDSGGCLNSIKLKLGYRFVLHKAVFPVKVERSVPFKFQLLIENIGYASPYNPRSAAIIFRNTVTKKEFIATLDVNPQLWFTGTYLVNQAIKIPADITPGNYALYISLPDASVSLSKRPEYAIQLADENMWENVTGYNNLNHIVRVE